MFRFLATESAPRAKCLSKWQKKRGKKCPESDSNRRLDQKVKIWAFFGPETLWVSYPPNLLTMANNYGDIGSKYRVTSLMLTLVLLT